MIEIRIKKDKDYSKSLILCNLLHASLELFDDTLKTEKFSKKDYNDLNDLLIELGFVIYGVCDIVEKYDK